MHNVRLYTDAAGGTHFADVEVALSPVDYPPPSPPGQLAAFTDATRFTFGALPAGWFRETYTVPRRQLVTILTGTWEVTASDGEVRHFRAGATILVEDTTGKGHTTRIVGDDHGRALFVQFPD